MHQNYSLDLTLMGDDARGMTRDEEADRHWAAVSNYTQLATVRRGRSRVGVRRRARVRLGLALVRVGLAVAPIRVADLEGWVAQALSSASA